MIRIEALTKRFGERAVLDGVDLQIDRGESRVIIGRSGTGKSVLLKLLLGILMPDSGKIIVDGTEMTELSPKERYRIRLKFGILFQGAALFDSLTVAGNVGFALVEHTRQTPGEIRSRVSECLEQVGLKGNEDLFPAELSGGMKKRVGLARAIAMKPEILLFDEPTTGLDPITADAINQLMIQLNDQLKTTSVTVTHDMASAFRIADRISMLHEGMILKTGSPDDFKSAEDPLVRSFVSGRSQE